MVLGSIPMACLISLVKIIETHSVWFVEIKRKLDDFMKIIILFVASEDKVGFVWLTEKKILPLVHYFFKPSTECFPKRKIMVIFFPHLVFLVMYLIYMKLT
jgi:hypothetical protein